MNGRSGGLSDGAVVALLGAALVLVIGASGYAGLHASSWVTGVPVSPAGNPVDVLVDVLEGRTQWTTAASVIVAGPVGLPLIVAFVAALAATSTPLDRQAPCLASKGEATHLTRKGATRKARALGIAETTAARAPGIALGEAVRSKFTVHSSWEDMVLLIAGPRTLKTTAYAIPAVLQALARCWPPPTSVTWSTKPGPSAQRPAPCGSSTPRP